MQPVSCQLDLSQNHISRKQTSLFSLTCYEMSADGAFADPDTLYLQGLVSALLVKRASDILVTPSSELPKLLYSALLALGCR